MTASIGAYLEQFRSRPTGGPDWLRTLRTEAIERFCSMGFPTRRSEEWRYTDLTPVARTPFRVGAPKTAGPPEDALAPLRLSSPMELVFVNGVLCEDLSRLPKLEGLRVQPLAATLGESEDGGPRPGDVVGLEHPFVCLNTAFLEHGAVVETAPDTVVADPLHMLFFWLPATEPRAVFPRLVLRLAPRSALHVVETHAGQGGEAPGLAAPVTEGILGEQATLRHTRIVSGPSGVYHMGVLAVAEDRGATFESSSVVTAPTLARLDVIARLQGEGASCRLDGIYVAGNGSHIDHHTFVDHAVPRCRSDQLYKGIVYGRGRGVFDGRVIVRPDAQRSDAHQLNRNLLLSDDAAVDVKPQLEIFADDVACTHGAAIGRLDPEALFYLRARGLGLSEARDLLVRGFANEVVERIGEETVQAAALQAIEPRFAELARETT